MHKSFECFMDSYITVKFSMNKQLAILSLTLDHCARSLFRNTTMDFLQVSANFPQLLHVNR